MRSEQEKQPNAETSRKDRFLFAWWPRTGFLSDQREIPGATFLLIMSVLLCNEWLKTPEQKVIYSPRGFFAGCGLCLAIYFLIALFPKIIQSLAFYLIGVAMGVVYLFFSRAQDKFWLVALILGYLIVDLAAKALRKRKKSQQ